MPKHLTLLIVLALGIAGCTPVAALPATPAPPTIAPSPIPPATASATPSLSLATQRPYVLFATSDRHFTIMDPQGKERRQFQLPDGGYAWIRGNLSLKDIVSPGGKWLAYFTGSSQEEPYDLTLRLFDLETGSTFPVARLIAPGFPENLEPVKSSDPAEFQDCADSNCRIGFIQSSFREGITSLSWSPDGRQLAFAAQIDGPSSDVYIFGLEDRSLRRLVDDLENVWSIAWTPNGEKILYQNSTAGPVYVSRYLYIADPNSKAVQSPPMVYGGTFWGEYGWINEDLYLVAGGGEGASAFDFQSINVDTLEMKVIWPYSAEYAVTDPAREAVVVSSIASGYKEGEPEDGLYLVSSDGSYSKLLTDLFALYPGFRESQVFGWRDNQLYSILLDGTVTPIGPSVWNEYQPPSASPDQKWILLREHQYKITLYSAETYQEIKTWDLDEYLYTLAWRQDSLGVFLSTEKHVYYLSIPDGEPVLLQDCSPSEICGVKDFVWLP